MYSSIKESQLILLEDVCTPSASHPFITLKAPTIVFTLMGHKRCCVALTRVAVWSQCSTSRKLLCKGETINGKKMSYGVWGILGVVVPESSFPFSVVYKMWEDILSEHARILTHKPFSCSNFWGVCIMAGAEMPRCCKNGPEGPMLSTNGMLPIPDLKKEESVSFGCSFYHTSGENQMFPFILQEERPSLQRKTSQTMRMTIVVVRARGMSSPLKVRLEESAQICLIQRKGEEVLSAGWPCVCTCRHSRVQFYICLLRHKSIKCGMT